MRGSSAAITAPLRTRRPDSERARNVPVSGSSMAHSLAISGRSVSFQKDRCIPLLSCKSYRLAPIITHGKIEETTTDGGRCFRHTFRGPAHSLRLWPGRKDLCGKGAQIRPTEGSSGGRGEADQDF